MTCRSGGGVWVTSGAVPPNAPEAAAASFTSVLLLKRAGEAPAASDGVTLDGGWAVVTLGPVARFRRRAIEIPSFTGAPSPSARDCGNSPHGCACLVGSPHTLDATTPPPCVWS
jgi:hypothetical protein